MKEMIKRVREEKGGFTLAELLIVVAIILVLVAIAIPVFSNANNEAMLSVAKADQRAGKSQAVSTYLLTNETGKQYYDVKVTQDGTTTVATSAATAATAVGTTTFEDGSIAKMVKEGRYPITFTVEVDGSEIDKPAKP